MRELLIGCGNNRRKKFTFDEFEWDELVTIDHDPDCGADILHDLNETPWPFEADQFDACHAYQVLEHLGKQGDAASFFAHFYEIWRVLKHGGLLYATCPSYNSLWAWGDPSHTRVINIGSLAFLSQEEYINQLGKTSMTDFRRIWKGDLRTVHAEDDGNDLTFVLKAIKE